MARIKSVELKNYYNNKKELVDKNLKIILDETSALDAKSYNDALKHTVLAKGKRIRPIMAIAIFELFDNDLSKIIAPACALEMVHAGSLMLDDLPCMDDAELRRGETTSHLLFGESTAILASAALWMKAINIVASVNHPSVDLLVRDTADFIGTKGLILGQYFDLEATKREFSLDELDKHYVLKTSSMFRLAVEYGAVLGCANKKQIESLDKFALHLGLAFQIRDDILDATESEEDTGKDTNKDEINHKQNYVSFVGLEKSRVAFNKHLSICEKHLDSTGLDTKFIKLIIDKLK